MLAVLDRYLVKEISLTFISASLVLILVIFGNLFVKLLSRATEGQIPASTIFPLLVLSGVQSATLLLPVSLLLAVMLTFGRLYRDNEMSALHACGIGYKRLYRPVMMVALPIAALLALMAFYVSPWTSRLANQITATLESEGQLTGITPGRFIETGDENLVFFVEGVDAARRRIQYVFIHTLEQGHATIETAAWATQRIASQSGDRIITLHQGHRYEGAPGRGDFRVLSFDTHTVRIPVQQTRLVRNSDRGSAPTSTLLASRQPADIAELQWRVSIPLSAILLALLALPLSYTTPRQGRYSKLALGIAIYIVYANLGLMMVNWVSRGLVPPWLGIWWVHAALLVLAGILFIRQGLGWNIWRLLWRRSLQ